MTALWIGLLITAVAAFAIALGLTVLVWKPRHPGSGYLDNLDDATRTKLRQ